MTDFIATIKSLLRFATWKKQAVQGQNINFILAS